MVGKEVRSLAKKIIKHGACLNVGLGMLGLVLAMAMVRKTAHASKDKRTAASPSSARSGASGDGLMLHQKSTVLV